MAHAYHLWVVVEKQSPALILGAYSVKAELKRWLADRPPWEEPVLIHCLKDGSTADTHTIYDPQAKPFK